MKTNIKYITALVLLLVMSSSSWADSGKIKVEHTPENLIISVATSENDTYTTVTTTGVAFTAGNTVYLKVSPASGYYVEKENIVVAKVIDSGQAQAPRRRTLDVIQNIVLTGSDDVDASEERIYTFQMPDADYNVMIDADAWPCIDFNDAVVTVTPVTYNGSLQTAVVTSVQHKGWTLPARCYTIAEVNEINANTTGYDVAVTGKNGYAGTAIGKFVINKKSVTVNGITVEDKVYDGNDTPVFNYEGVTFGGIVDGDVLTVTAAGKLLYSNVVSGNRVNITGFTLGGASASNYEMATSGNQATADATILPKPIDVSWNQEQLSLQYNGNAQAPNATINSGQLVSGTACGLTYTGKGTAVGHYTVTAAADNVNYVISDGTKSQEYDIVAIPSAVTTAPVGATGLTYTGTALQIVNATNAAATGGTLVYAATQDGTYGEAAAVTQTDAGTYSFWYKVLGAANHSDTAPVEVTGITIEKAAYTVTGTAVATATYGTAVKNIAISGLTVKGVDNNVVEGTWAFDADDNTILHTGNTVKEVATFTPTTPNANYAPLTMEIAPMLVPKSITITWGGETTFAYDGTEKKPTATIDDGQLVGDDVCGLSISGGATDKGNYTATATATNGDYVVYNDTQDFTIGNRVIVLNETDGWATLNQHNGETVDMSFTRNFVANETSTVCLPFDYTPVAADGKCYTFTGVDVDGSGDYTVTMTETDQKIAAGTAFIFKKATNDGVVVFHNGAYDVPSGGYSDVIPTTKDAWTFSGTYTKKTWEAPQTNLYGFAASDFVPTAGGTVNAGDFVRFNSGYTNAFRAYMMYNSSGAPAMNHANSTLPDRMKVVLVDTGAMATDISSPAKVAAVAEGWYAMDGRKLQNKPTKKGLYIYGGRTVVVK